MRFFNDCTTAEELKSEYRRLAKTHHPDNGGNPEVFKEVQKCFSMVWETLKDKHKNKDGEDYTSTSDESAKEFMALIDQLTRLQGVETEICGSWIWCSGNTKPYKDFFKSLLFRWSRSKQAWYYHSKPYYKKGSRELSLDEIRAMYGSTSYESKKEALFLGTK